MKIKFTPKKRVPALPAVVKSKFRPAYAFQTILSVVFAICCLLYRVLWPWSFLFGILIGGWSLIGYLTRNIFILAKERISVYSVRGRLIIDATYENIKAYKTEMIPQTILRNGMYVLTGFHVTHITFDTGDSFMISQNDYQNYHLLRRKLFTEIHNARKKIQAPQ